MLSEIFGSASVQNAGSFARRLTSLGYKPATIIFHEGEPGRCAYLIERGQVEISRRAGGEKQVLAVLGEGDLFGEMAPIDNQRRSATATALADTDLIPIDRDQIDQLVSHADPLMSLLLRVLLTRIRSSQSQDARCRQDAADGHGTFPVATDRTYRAVHARAVAQIKLEKTLEEAIDAREFELHFQPIVSCSDYLTAGFEALLRWRRPTQGLVLPTDFVGQAEDNGLIVPIERWVLEEACQAQLRLAEMLRKYKPELPPPFVSVNVSGRQLQRLDNVQVLVEVIRDSGVQPGAIKLEITERVLVDDPELALIGLSHLRELGASVAVDDFGTGYSSLSYLHRFRPDTLKIDQSFVRSMLQDEGSLRIVRAIVGLARELDILVVAEGVEQVAEFKRLQDLGCHYAQGYLLSRPLSEEAAAELLLSESSQAAAFRHARPWGR